MRDQQFWIEQQSGPTPVECAQDSTDCVWNPTNHLWDIDDSVEFGAYGKLAAGATTSVSDSIIADSTHHMVGVLITSPSPNLTATVTFQPQDVTWEFTPELVNGKYEYRGCVVGPVYSNSPPDGPVIEGSNGGIGFVTHYTFIVTNPTNRTVRGTLARLTYRSAEPLHQAVYCRSDPQTPISVGGAVWHDGR